LGIGGGGLVLLLALLGVAVIARVALDQKLRSFRQIPGASTPWDKPFAPSLDKNRLSPSGIYQPAPGEHPFLNPHFSSDADRFDYYSPHRRRQYDPSDADNRPLNPGG
jgi:hypothetical protein